MIADFPKHKRVEYYKMFTEFTRDYYGMDPLTVSNFVDIVTYKEEFPISISMYQNKVNVSARVLSISR